MTAPTKGRLATLLQSTRAWREGPNAERIARVGSLLVLLGATAQFAFFLNGQYAIREWLFWILAQAWALSLIFALACLSTGFVLTRWLLGKWLTSVELFTLAMPMGIFAFSVLMFVLGLAGLLGPTLFALLPLSMIAVGAKPLLLHARRWLRHRLAFRERHPPSMWMILAWGFGLIVLGMAYFLILSPANISFDARWKHLGIAEHYGTQGFVGPFLEGWTPGTAPHLPSFLYAWAFLIRPWGDLFGQLSLVAHMEFVIFLSALVGIGALVRRLVPGADPRWVWVVRFLFPGMLLYDSNLSAGTDHIAAIFAIPIFLATMRVWRNMSVRDSIVLAVMISGAILTKYSSAFSMLLFPVLAVALRAVALGWRSMRAQAPQPRSFAWLLAPFACLGAGLALTSTHWLKNWIWYGSPLYPAGANFFSVRPWTPDAADVFRYGYLAQLWRPPVSWEGFVSSVKVLFTFSFLPHNYPHFHKTFPVFGSLFTLALLCLPFVRASRWLWSLFASVHLGVFTWFWIHHQDRHLQSLMPLMAAATAAVMILLWRQGKAVRVALGLAIGLQVVWGGDVWFFPTHNMAKTPIVASAELVASGFTKKPEQRLRTFTSIAKVRDAIPRGAKLLLHDINPHVGIGVPSIKDTKGWQGAISYGHLRTPGAIYDKYRELGVTHLLWTANSRGADSLAADVAFWNFAEGYTKNRKRLDRYILAEMPSERPPDTEPGHVLLLGCNEHYQDGLYALENLTVPAYGGAPPVWPKPSVSVEGPGQAKELLNRASFVLLEKGCASAPSGLDRSFQRVANRNRRGRNPYAFYRKDNWEIWQARDPRPIQSDPIGGILGGE